MITRLLKGSVAGFTATFPMTGVMEVLHKWLPLEQQYPLPPSDITSTLADAAGLEEVDEAAHTPLTYADHFGYGTATGAGYALIADQLPFPKPINGMLYGFGIWAGSYLGWLPALGIRHSSIKSPAERNALMIAAHLVWGATLSSLFHVLEEED